MRMRASSVLVALLFAVPAVAQQTEGQEGKQVPSKTEKLWKIQCSGISG